MEEGAWHGNLCGVALAVRFWPTFLAKASGNFNHPSVNFKGTSITV
jgi:hypothetical protein